jgi:putative CocE/NonD family hydrolase
MVWFDAMLKGDRAGLRERPVAAWFIGEGWRYYDEWPPAGRELRLHLHSNGRLSEGAPADGDLPDQYRYDPHRPTPSLGGPLMSKQAGPQDNAILERRKDVLIYTSAPLENDLAAAGAGRVRLYVHSSCLWTDFFARICVVEAGGKSVNLCDGILRVEPGMSELQPDGSLRLDLELWPTAVVFKAGQRIRLQISSGAFPRYTRNPGTGEPAATAVRMLPANQTVYHDATHPSALILPVLA